MPPGFFLSPPFSSAFLPADFFLGQQRKCHTINILQLSGLSRKAASHLCQEQSWHLTGQTQGTCLLLSQSLCTG